MSPSASCDATLLPERLHLARRRRGLTQKELALLLGVTPRTVSRYEKAGAPSDMLDKVSQALDFPSSYFHREVEEEIHEPSVQFRAQRSSTKRVREAAMSTGQHAAELDAWIISHYSMPALDLPDLEGASPGEAASELRFHWALGQAPLPNLVQLLESKGVHCFGLPPSTRNVDAFSTWHGDRPIILLSRDKTPERARFTLAHELGHLVMHRDATELSEPEREKEANLFASEFLMPRQAMQALVPYNPSVTEVLNFRAKFKVSAMAAVKALNNAGLLSEWNHRSMMSILAQEGFRNSEPGGMARHEASRIFGTIFSHEFNRHTSISEVAEALALPPEDVHWLTLETANNSFTGAASNTQATSRARPNLRLVQ